jgi:hypothetical protein
MVDSFFILEHGCKLDRCICINGFGGTDTNACVFLWHGSFYRLFFFSMNGYYSWYGILLFYEILWTDQNSADIFLFFFFGIKKVWYQVWIEKNNYKLGILLVWILYCWEQCFMIWIFLSQILGICNLVRGSFLRCCPVSVLVWCWRWYIAPLS